MKTAAARQFLESFISRYRQRTPKSGSHYQRCTRVSPGGVNSNLRAWEPYPVYFVRAEGSRICDLDGNEYLACAAAHSVLIVGHRNPTRLKAVRRQLELRTVNGASPASEFALCELIL